MGRAPCCDKANVKKGPWSPEEDAKLKSYIDQHGTGGNWIALPQKIGLKRCGKSCRLRWLNYLRPNIKHGGFSEEEDNIICSLYINIGSRWSIIASQLPGRTDNDIKNYWNTRLKKKLFGKQRKEQQRNRVAAAVTGSLNQEVKGSVDHEAGNLGITNTVGTAGLFAYWPQPPAASMLPLVGGHVDDSVDQASASIRKLLSKLEGRFTSAGATDENPLMQVSSSSMPAQTILGSSTSLVPPVQCDRSSQETQAPNLYSTELDEMFRFNSVKLESLDYFQGSGEVADESMNWNEVSPLMYPNNIISGYQGLMQQCPFEDPVHLGVQ